MLPDKMRFPIRRKPPPPVSAVTPEDDEGEPQHCHGAQANQGAFSLPGANVGPLALTATLNASSFFLFLNILT